VADKEIELRLIEGQLHNLETEKKHLVTLCKYNRSWIVNEKRAEANEVVAEQRKALEEKRKSVDEGSKGLEISKYILERRESELQDLLVA